MVLGLIELKDERETDKAYHPDSTIIVEWRALTVALIDRLAQEIRRELNLNSEEFPLETVLQGGTWWAGRKIAHKKRSGGAPPIRIVSDGTIF